VEVGNGKWEVGMRKSEKKEGEKLRRWEKERSGKWECGSGNRKEVGPVVVPGGRDYAAANMRKWER
jgi:hypothetical protein